jgi:hypothetical protein
MSSSKSPGKNNTPSKARYKSEKRWEKNKIKHLQKIVKKQPNNKQVINLLNK